MNGEKSLNLILQGENPYTVNAVMRAVVGNDYEKLKGEYSKLEMRFYSLVSAVEDIGYSIEYDENYNVRLRRD